MKTKRPEAASFSMGDFERGLVLAGLLTPRSVQELEEKEILQTYESQGKRKVAKNNAGKPAGEIKNLYFKRVVLAAEIVSTLHEEPTFGRIKFQKLVYLCEHAALMNLQHRYLKLVAGPFDNKFMHTIEREFKRLNWFVVEKVKQTSITRSKYIPLPECDGYKKYYSSYFRDSESDISQIIELFRKKKTEFAEISATLFACYLELKEKTSRIDEQELLSLFYNWSERKAKFDKSIVLENWRWLQEHGLITVA